VSGRPQKIRRIRTCAAWLRRLPAALLALACLIPPAFAQRYSFKYYGQEEGLSNLATECLFQDHAGYLWVGTQNGLFRYDGASFTRFGESEGLPSSSIESLTETPDGALWVATQAGLARRKGARFEEVSLGKRVEHAGHFGLASDSLGRLYVSTTAGLMVSHAGGFEAVRGLPSGQTHGLSVTREGTVWYGCGPGVCRLANGSVTVFGTREGVPPDRWDALLTDRDDTVWIRSSRHLLKKARASSRFEGIPQAIPNIGDFAALSLGRNGELFVPTDEGVWELAKGRWRGIGQPQGLVSASTSAVLEDREGSIWIGLWGAGVARWLGRNQWEGWTRADGLSGEHIWGMTRDRRGDLWVTTDKGVNQLRREPGTGKALWRAWTEKEGIAGNKTRAIALAADGAVWVGSSPGGISRIDPIRGGVRRFWLPKGPANDRIWNLAFDRAGTLWVSTRGGLFFAKPGTGHTSFERQQLPLGDAGEMVVAALEDQRARLWVAGTRGLARRENGLWKRFTTADGLATNSAGFLAEGPDGSLWMGYRDRSGLSKIDVEGDRLSLHTFNHNSGLRSDQAIFVRVDRRGWVWFGTDHGVDVLRDGKWRHYGQQDGMIWDDCDSDAIYADTDGSMWIGTSRGLAHFLVPASEPALAGPRVEFSRFQLGQRTLNTAGPIVVPYRHYALSARLSVLTFLAENDVLCRYRVVGLDQDWLETKEREVRFSNLPYGKFTLEAMARNAAGKWSRAPARIPFEILPPWWATWWFRLAVLLAAPLVILLLFRWRTRRLRQKQSQLEIAVEERTRQLRLERARIEQQNSEIERLLGEARQASLLKDEFLANMSHEIRTPMHGILGMVDCVLAEEMPPGQKQSLKTVHSCAKSLLSILNDILDFSKVEAGRLEIVPAPFRVAATVEDACSIFSNGARDKGIEIAWEIAKEVPEWLECDAGRIRQVLLNLVGNAIKFTHRGEVRVSASAENANGEWVDLHFTVSDTGIGIPEEARVSIFEAFRQADGSTSRTYGGTGLGLTISSRLVELMGGKISVESEAGRGSVFRFWVKARRTEPALESPERHGESAPAGSLRILLAEDNPVNQKVATALLTKRGHCVEVVGNGRLAVERSEAGAFDLILMDLQMPEMDGWEATRQIRRRDRELGVRVPILALTAHAMGKAQEDCLAAGMDAVIVKPFEPAQFYAAVEKAVSANCGIVS
jgi:signal transduction histidine kinase/ligand-binding sensor domain-containing protein/ActR/RegA family two-component response regulator